MGDLNEGEGVVIVAIDCVDGFIFELSDEDLAEKTLMALEKKKGV